MTWVEQHDSIKQKYLSIAPKLWWGDDLDVRFLLVKELAEIRGKKILDVGCNIGMILSFLDSSNEAYGFDIDEFCVLEARKLNSTAHIEKASMDSMPYEANYFDIVVMSNVFPYFDFSLPENVKNDFIKATFSEVSRVLKGDGLLYLTTPNGGHGYYKNAKAKFSDLQDALGGFQLEISGWNNMPQMLPSFLPRRYRFIPPRFLYMFEFVWKYMEKKRFENIENARYFFVKAKNKEANL